jgi:hypothetical protein
MKRFFTVITLCVMTFWGSHTLMARGFGIIGGASFTNIRDVSSGLTTSYHAGLTYKFDLPFGFAVQPSLLYHAKSSNVETALSEGGSFDLKAGYLELPVSIQWGPDLILFRPFLDVTPFVGYGLNNDIEGWKTNDWDNLQRLEYGVGLGVGMDIWKFQLIGRYNWNFGQLFTTNSILPKDANFGGVTLSLAFLF